MSSNQKGVTMLRVSTTTLEAYRRLIETEYGREDELIAQVRRRPFLPSWQMNAGSAWAAVLARPMTVPRPFEVSGHYAFDVEAVRQAKTILGPGVSEVKATRLFTVGGRPVTLVAQADHVNGLMLSENKAKFSQADCRDYESGLQWRCYLLCHEAAVVQYNLFSFKDPATSTDFHGITQNYCALKGITSFRFWPYESLESDVMGWLDAFLGWADGKGLTHYLEREGSTQETAA